MTSNAETVEAYIAEAPAKREEALLKIRALCIKHLPNYQEDLSYKMPTYKLDGDAQVAFASQKQYISVYFLIHSVMLNKSKLL